MTAGDDSILAAGQVIKAPEGKYLSVQYLAAGEIGLAAGFVNRSYADGSTSSGQVLVPAWWAWPYPSSGEPVFPTYYTNKTVDYNRSNIFLTTSWRDSTKRLTSIQLPNVTAGSNSGLGGAAIMIRLHIFAMALVRAQETGLSNSLKLEVQYARSTKNWFPGTNKTQIVEVPVNNLGPEWALSNNSMNATVQSNGVKTIRPG